jgi:hypothetical protein
MVEAREVERCGILFRVRLPVDELQMGQMSGRKVGREAEEVGQFYRETA